MTLTRDMFGYGGNPPIAAWPNGARIAVQFVLNYEEGAERCVLDGDKESEAFLSEIIGAAPFAGARHMSMESIYEYGSRAGVWRILDLFQQRGVPLTVFAVALAAKKHPAVIERMLKDGHEIASHGLRWIDYKDVPRPVEREHMEQAVAILTDLCGAPPLGWYTGRTSVHTRDLAAAHGGFLYDADDYSDDLPFWSAVTKTPHLIVPYTLDANDMRFATAQGFNAGAQFETYLRDAFDVLYAEGEHRPKMMSIGLHCRLIGRPGRFGALQRFLDYVLSHDDVWVCRRVDIARHWRAQHPHPDDGSKAGDYMGEGTISVNSPDMNAAPGMNTGSGINAATGIDAATHNESDMTRTEFIARYGGVYEHSPWVAERYFDSGALAHEQSSSVPPSSVPSSIILAFQRIVDEASYEEQLALLRAHPDLAGKLAISGGLTEASSAEQKSAGLDQCSAEEFAEFQKLNNEYTQKFGFPFIFAVSGFGREEILAAFRRRVHHDAREEFQTALAQVHKIAAIRLEKLAQESA